MKTQYLVVCSDENELILASRTVFTSFESAKSYCNSIAPTRQPQIVKCQFEIATNNGSLRPEYKSWS